MKRSTTPTTSNRSEYCCVEETENDSTNTAEDNRLKKSSIPITFSDGKVGEYYGDKETQNDDCQVQF